MEKLSIKAIRTNLNLTQKEMAESLGIDFRRYQNIEHGTVTIKGSELIEMCRKFGINPFSVKV